jgi:cytochrome c nitrite reductase small subunit
MRSSRPWLALLLCVVVGVFVGAGASTAHYAQATAYLSDDPKACTNCHVMRPHYDGWLKASHHATATCNDCHLPTGFVSKYLAKALNGWNHSKAFTLQDFPEPIRIHPSNRAILERNCVRCHAGLVQEFGTHPEGRCVVCHGEVGHGPLR